MYEPHHEKTNILHICQNKGAIQLNCEADQLLYFRYTDSTVLTIFCTCTAPCVSDLFEDHVVGFLMTRLICNHETIKQWRRDAQLSITDLDCFNR